MIKLFITVACFWIFSSTQAYEMSIEEKVGQLLIVHFNGAVANTDAEILIREAHVSGFIFYNWANELSSPKQVMTLTSSLKQTENKKHPLFLAVDQEGGRVCRLKNGFTVFPSQQDIEKTDNPDLAYQCAKKIGIELKNVGINMNFAPVADVNSNPLNPVIGDRAFGSVPTRVAQFCEQALRGYKEVSMIAALKHFPGHGDVDVDSHLAIPVIRKSINQLDANEWVPFHTLSGNAPLIMTAHLLVPALDPEFCTTVSPNIVTGILRERFGYKGVIISDSLAMEGALKQTSSLEELALKAFLAGHDLLLLGGKQLFNTDNGFEITPEKVLSIANYLVNAVKQSRISEERLNASVERILTLKKAYGLFSEIEEYK